LGSKSTCSFTWVPSGLSRLICTWLPAVMFPKTVVVIELGVPMLLS
jgi:hypothetical protein